MKADIELRILTLEHLKEYAAALREGWSPTTCAASPPPRTEQIEADAKDFVDRQIDCGRARTCRV